MLFWTLDVEKEKRFFFGFFGAIGVTKKGSKKYWKNNIQESFTNKSTILHQTPLITFLYSPSIYVWWFQSWGNEKLGFFISSQIMKIQKCIFPFKPARSSQIPGMKALAVFSNPLLPWDFILFYGPSFFTFLIPCSVKLEFSSNLSFVGNPVFYFSTIKEYRRRLLKWFWRTFYY